MSERRRRSGPEWATFAGCCLVLLIPVGSIIVHLRSPQSPASPAASIAAPAREDGGRYLVEVLVANHGDETAANVQVVAELTIDGRPSTGDQVVDFLAGGEQEKLVFSFREDPAQGELTVEVAGFALP